MESLRVLIVDDEEDLVQALEERLSLRGIKATGVTSGADALGLIRTEPYDVLLVDVRMPGIGGLQVIREVKAKLPGLEVILLTGHGSVEDAEEGMRLGAFEYLTKPVNIDDLIEVLRQAAGRRDSARQ
jgi:DNA-binding NtrC family response regulator